MSVNVCMPLFGNPGQELEEGIPLKGQHLRTLAEDLHARLYQAADMLDRVAAAGWTTQLAMHDVLLLHEDVQTTEEAVRRLRELGIDPEGLMILEEVEEESA
jgi:hypothetical protein